MFPNIRLFLIAAGIFSLTACTKDELTQPASVKLQMTMQSEGVNMRQEKSGSLIKIEKARYRLSEIDFEGYRQTGADYFFTKDFESGYEVVVESGAPTPVIDFDMPQGEYEKVNINLTVRKSGKSDGRLESPGRKLHDGDLPYNSEAAIIMEGYYINTKEEQIPLIFVYDFDEIFKYGASGQQKIIVEKDQKSIASIDFDHSYWFQLINGRMLQSARLTEVNGQATIILSKDQNDHIFNLLTSRIEKASKLTFK